MTRTPLTAGRKLPGLSGNRWKKSRGTMSSLWRTLSTSSLVEFHILDTGELERNKELLGKALKIEEGSIKFLYAPSLSCETSISSITPTYISWYVSLAPRFGF